MRLDLFPHPFGEGHRRVEHRAREQQHELLPPEATRPIDLADFVPQDARELLQHCVTRLMAVGIVDALEAIEIAHHAGERLVEPLGVLEHLLETFFQISPVVEPREHVGLRHVPKSFIRFEQLALALLELLLQAFDPQHRLEPRLELREVDRLRDVIVRARLESLDLVLGRVERRLHDDRNERQRFVRLDPAGDFDTVDLRHHDVEQDQVRRGRIDLVQRLRAVAGRFRPVPPRFEPRPQQLDIVLVIVDDQDAGGRLRVTRGFHHSSRESVAPRPQRLAARMASRDIHRSPPPSLSRDPTPARAR